MDMIRLLAKGVTDQEQFFNCARGKVKAKKEQLIKALDGTFQAYHHTQNETNKKIGVLTNGNH